MTHQRMFFPLSNLINVFDFMIFISLTVRDLCGLPDPGTEKKKKKLVSRGHATTV